MSSEKDVNVLSAPLDKEDKGDNVGKVTDDSNPPNPPPVEQKLVNIEVKDQNIALNLMVSFLSLANKRGVFSLDESAKVWECVQKFQDPKSKQ